MKISIVFASPSTFNAGMQMVDKAWDSFAQRNLPKDIEYKKYRYNAISYKGSSDTIFNCLIKDHEEMLSADKIIYWGDFLHMQHYHERKAKQLFKIGSFSSFEKALNFVQKTLILKNENEDIQRKAISFGTNQMLDNTTDKLREPGFSELNNLIRNARAWLPRDLYTANYADIIRNGKDSTQGVDCALLAWSNLFESSFELDKKNRSGRVGCFFGRSSSRYLKLSNFAKKLTRSQKCKLIWIPWIEKTGKFDPLRERIYKLRVDDTKTGYNLDFENIEWLSSFDFIITDTYHLAVNAWASGTPAICVADTISKQRSSGGEFSWNDKRHMFFQMADALDFFVHGQELDSWRRKKDRLIHLQECLHNKELVQWIFKKISLQAQIAEKRLLKAITE